MKSTLQELLAELPRPVLTHIQNLERMRQDFVANVSHELRTPLTVIHGYLETLLEQTEAEHKQENKQAHKIFSQMYQQTLRMENLLADLLLLSSLETDEQLQPSKQAVDVAELLKVICDEAKQISGNANHHISLEADTSLKLRGNENELRSLFSNIIFNAVKYTPKGGKIAVTWQRQKNEAKFTVKDTGIGISKEHIPRITERFYRVDKARSRESGGTGLGLAIVKHVLLRHEGKLEIDSKIGEGSVFTCVFPASRII